MHRKNLVTKHVINFYDDEYYAIDTPTLASSPEPISVNPELSLFELKSELTKFRVDLSRLTRKIDSSSNSDPDFSEVNFGLRTILERLQNLETKFSQKESHVQLVPDANSEQEKYQKRIGREIIEVLDSFDRIIKLMGADILNTSVGTGILAIRQQLEHKLKLWQFSTIESTEIFDPNLHMAVSTDWDPTKPLDSILAIHLRGYMYKGLIFRNAEVTVNRQAKS